MFATGRFLKQIVVFTWQLKWWKPRQLSAEEDRVAALGTVYDGGASAGDVSGRGAPGEVAPPL